MCVRIGVGGSAHGVNCKAEDEARNTAGIEQQSEQETGEHQDVTLSLQVDAHSLQVNRHTGNVYLRSTSQQERVSQRSQCVRGQVRA